jgi:hypothetical protein
VPALRRLLGKAFHTVDVDRALFAVWTDEPGHSPDRSHAF